MEVCNFDFSTSIFGFQLISYLFSARAYHGAPPLAVTVAQAITLLGCLTPQNRAQIRRSIPDTLDDVHKDTQDELADFKSILLNFSRPVLTTKHFLSEIEGRS